MAGIFLEAVRGGKKAPSLFVRQHPRAAARLITASYTLTSSSIAAAATFAAHNLLTEAPTALLFTAAESPFLLLTEVAYLTAGLATLIGLKISGWRNKRFTRTEKHGKDVDEIHQQFRSAKTVFGRFQAAIKLYETLLDAPFGSVSRTAVKHVKTLMRTEEKRINEFAGKLLSTLERISSQTDLTQIQRNDINEILTRTKDEIDGLTAHVAQTGDPFADEASRAKFIKLAFSGFCKYLEPLLRKQLKDELSRTLWWKRDYERAKSLAVKLEMTGAAVDSLTLLEIDAGLKK